MRTVSLMMRTRASEMRAQAEAMQWESSAAQMFRAQIDIAALDLGRCASQVDDAAHQLIAHANSVDVVKQAIEDARHFVEGLVDDAKHLVNNIVRGVSEAGEAVVNTLFGREIPDWTVNRAERLLTIFPVKPTTGSRDWLDIRTRVNGQGW